MPLQLPYGGEKTQFLYFLAYQSDSIPPPHLLFRIFLATATCKNMQNLQLFRIYGYLCCTLNAIELALNKWHGAQSDSPALDPPSCTPFRRWNKRCPQHPFLSALASLSFCVFGCLSKHFSYILYIAFQYAFLICVCQLESKCNRIAFMYVYKIYLAFRGPVVGQYLNTDALIKNSVKWLRFSSKIFIVNLYVLSWALKRKSLFDQLMVNWNRVKIVANYKNYW